MAENYDQIYKVILAGDAFVGKTHLVYKFIKTGNQNNKNISPTVGVQFSSKLVKLNDGKKIKVQIWDTAGQQQYRSITAAHYRKAKGALVVYDITKQATFRNIKRWVEGIREHASQNVVIVIVGNKSDLKAQQSVTTAQGRRLAKELGAIFEQASAITNDNVENTFMTMLEQIQKRKKQETTKEQSQGFHLRVPEQRQQQKCEC